MKRPIAMGSLTIRIAAPVVLACLVAGAGLYAAVMSAVGRLSESQLQYFVTEAKQDITAACERALSDLERSPLAGDGREGRIRRARVMGEIEDLLRERKMMGLIREGDRTLALNRDLAPDLAGALDAAAGDGAFALVRHDGVRYAARDRCHPGVIEVNAFRRHWELVTAVDRHDGPPPRKKIAMCGSPVCYTPRPWRSRSRAPDSTSSSWRRRNGASRSSASAMMP